MNNPTENNTLENLQNHIDRMVCGELDDASRTQLICFLEDHRDSWRNVGLAFLEAQCWREALALESSIKSSNVKRLSVVNQPNAHTPNRNRSRLSWLPLLAASWAIVFAGGWWLHDKSTSSRLTTDASLAEQTNDSKQGEFIWATVNSRAISTPLVGARLQLPLRVQGDELISVCNWPSISDYEIDVLRRQGVELRTEQRYVNATLPDGRDVSIPVEHYITSKTTTTVN
jgi:hypothetical protein